MALSLLRPQKPHGASLNAMKLEVSLIDTVGTLSLLLQEEWLGMEALEFLGRSGLPGVLRVGDRLRGCMALMMQEEGSAHPHTPLPCW